MADIIYALHEYGRLPDHEILRNQDNTIFQDHWLSGILYLFSENENSYTLCSPIGFNSILVNAKVVPNTPPHIFFTAHCSH